MLIVDTDILSMFAKADALSILVELIGQERIGMTPAIAEELGVPLQYGYDFPQKVFSMVRVVPLGASVAEELVRLQARLRLARESGKPLPFARPKGRFLPATTPKREVVPRPRGYRWFRYRPCCAVSGSAVLMLKRR